MTFSDHVVLAMSVVTAALTAILTFRFANQILPGSPNVAHALLVSTLVLSCNCIFIYLSIRKRLAFILSGDAEYEISRIRLSMISMAACMCVAQCQLLILFILSAADRAAHIR